MKQKILTAKDIAFLKALSAKDDMAVLNEIKKMSKPELDAFIQSEKGDYAAFREQLKKRIHGNSETVDQNIIELTSIGSGALETPHSSSDKPSPLISKIRQARQKFRDYFEQCYQINIVPQATATAQKSSAAFKCEYQTGKFGTLYFGKIPEKEDVQLMFFKCPKESIGDLEGLVVRVNIGDKSYDLGEIDSRGMAENEIEVNSGLYLQDITVSIDKK